MIKLFQVVKALDVLDLVVAQIQTAQFCERVEALDVRDEVVVQFEVLEGRGERVRKFDGMDRVLA